MSDTSPLRALQALGHIALLTELYARVVIPPAVRAELDVEVPELGRFPFELIPAMRVVHPRDGTMVQSLRAVLDAGEAEAIAVCLEIGRPLLLIDEYAGRGHARRLGLRTRGVLGLLVDAKERGLIVAVAPLLPIIQRRLTFHLSPAVIELTLRQAHEWPPQ